MGLITSRRNELLTAGLIVVSLVLLGSRLPRATAVHAASSSDQRAAGAVLFHERGCEHCHGADGIGSERGPNLWTVGKRLPKDTIEHQIHDGGGGMPAFGEALQPDEIQQLVAFLAAKKKAPKGAKLPAISPPARPVPTPAGGSDDQ